MQNTLKTMKTQPLFLLICACTILTLSSLGFTNPDEARINRVKQLVPALPEEVVYHLIMSDDGMLVGYVRSLGRRSARRYWVHLREKLDYSSLESYEASSSVLLPLMNRLDMAISSAFFPGDPPSDCGCYDLPPKNAIIRNKLWHKRKAIKTNADLSGIDKIAAITAVAKNFEEIGCTLEAELSYSFIGQLHAELGNTRESLECFRRALAAAEKYRCSGYICQLYGVIGSIYQDLGQIDSMKVYWDKALGLSIYWIVPSQTARILTFYASYYAKQGRLSLAHSLFEEALTICKEEDLGQDGIRYELDALNFHAGLGAWEIVGRMLSHIKGIPIDMFDYEGNIRKLLEVRIKQMEARYLMGLGKVDIAEQIYNDILQALRELPWPDRYLLCLLERAQGLMDNHQADKALPLIREGYQQAHGTNQPVIAARFLILEAKALYRQGDIPSSQQVLELFDRQAESFAEALQSERLAADALRLRFALAEGVERDVALAAEKALVRLENTITNMDASGHSYLWMANCEELRHLLHDIAWGDAETGYGIEMYWRCLYCMLGSASRNVLHGGPRLADTGESSNFMELFRLRAKTAYEQIVKQGAVHCVYLVHNDDVLRWTCTETGVQCESLDISANELNTLVKRATIAMASDPLDPDATPNPQLQADLRFLAGELLPSEVLNRHKDTDAGPFFVSTEGLLEKLPFEILNISDDDEYIPLLLNWDVAYLRHNHETPAIDKPRRGIVLVNDNPVGKIRDTIVFGGDANAALDEGLAVAEVLPDAVFLQGDSATKSNLLEHWDNASLIYIASHFIRDPDVPYLAFVPLSNPYNIPRPEASLLDVEDVRASNLECCHVVVLSGCASGAPYIGVHNSSAGFGSAFLDAGAGSVIQTFWIVNDEDAKDLMSSFASRWSNETTSVIRALSDTKRSFMKGANGIRHPFNWAAYSVKVGRL